MPSHSTLFSIAPHSGEESKVLTHTRGCIGAYTGEYTHTYREGTHTRIHRDTHTKRRRAHTHTCTRNTHMRAHTGTYMRTHRHTRPHIHRGMHIHTHMHTHTRIHTEACTHAHTHTHTHTHLTSEHSSAPSVCFSGRNMMVCESSDTSPAARSNANSPMFASKTRSNSANSP